MLGFDSGLPFVDYIVFFFFFSVLGHLVGLYGDLAEGLNGCEKGFSGVVQRQEPP